MEINKYITDSQINVINVLSKIDENGHGIMFVVDENKKLIGSVSDGDIRRWIINTNDLTAKVSDFMNCNPKFVTSDNVKNFKKLFNMYPIKLIPVLNSKNQIIDLIFKDQNKDEENLKDKFSAPVVIMAGGKGTRLYPYTKILPKPLIPIGDTPILERIINKFVDYGLEKFYLTVNYKKSMIKSYFSELNPKYDIVYVEENKPLGTGGSIKLIKDTFSQPIIVANCDQLINANYKELYEYHKDSGNEITIVSSLKNITIPYGVLNTCENGVVTSIDEKPKLSYFINTGMYVVNPTTIKLIPDDVMFHMTDLIDKVMEQGGKIGMYPISEDSFLDMGEFSEMKRMEEKLNKMTELT